MVYLGSGNYEFMNDITLNIDELKDILIDLYTSNDYTVKQDILETISKFECVYTEEDLEFATENINEKCEDERLDAYNEGYRNGYNDGVRELK